MEARARLFVGGLPFGMEEDELVAWLMAEHGIEVTSALILRKRNGWSKGAAAVLVRDGDAARAAIAALDGTTGPNPAKRMVAKAWDGLSPPEPGKREPPRSPTASGDRPSASLSRREASPNREAEPGQPPVGNIDVSIGR
ncbi:hypothetical protein KFE25_004470 [Diacronema lutheri]|uniref:RRM domain-containing protein n=1 Tax=Diacronema lutheri TaxID=2081491 RepID=A0A8J6C2W7_DIALT|nr:hypothetical protein KFE25_004470 [Diacronema lutheri]